jgi:hypothetical protein
MFCSTKAIFFFGLIRLLGIQNCPRSAGAVQDRTIVTVIGSVSRVSGNSYLGIISGLLVIHPPLEDLRPGTQSNACCSRCALFEFGRIQEDRTSFTFGPVALYI